jgi:hypothetical protein
MRSLSMSSGRRWHNSERRMPWSRAPSGWCGAADSWWTLSGGPLPLGSTRWVFARRRSLGRGRSSYENGRFRTFPNRKRSAASGPRPFWVDLSLLHQVQLIFTHVLGPELIRRTVEMHSELPNRADVAACASLRVTTALELFEHPFSKLDHKNLLVTHTIDLRFQPHPSSTLLWKLP